MSNDLAAAEGLGSHLAIDLYDCASPDIDDIAWVRDVLMRAANIVGGDVVNDCFHRFLPHGVSGVVVISELHIAIHTWPERRFVAVDAFTCGSMSHFNDVVSFLKVEFVAADAEAVMTPRGVGVSARRAPRAGRRDEMIQPAGVGPPIVRQGDAQVVETPTQTPIEAAPVPSRPYPLAPLPPGRYYVDHELPGEPVADVFCTDSSDPFDLYSFRARSVVVSKRTAFQHVVVADTYGFGRALFIDGSIQSSADDEALYHELLVQPAMLLHPEPRDVLIIGGGEGATLRETLAHASVRRACMVDIDREAVEICREHLTAWHRGAFDDPRVELRFADGRAHVEADENLYDVVIVDVVDMLDNGPAQNLYTRQFYELLKRRLRPEGIVAVQGLEFSCLDYKEHCALRRTLATAFADVHSYSALVPSFLGSWGFLIASDALPAELITAGTNRRGDRPQARTGLADPRRRPVPRLPLRP